VINAPNHTKAIVLSRINYAETDRILRLLTKDYGKLSVLAKGSRKERSKLAGGIELFNINEIGFVNGRGEISTLVSSRLIDHYDKFIADLERVEFAYKCLKKIDKITESTTSERYYYLVEELLKDLNENGISLPIISCWWYVNLSNITGHAINTDIVIGGGAFEENAHYYFDIDRGSFSKEQTGIYGPNHIKFLKIALANKPNILNKIKNATNIANDLCPLLSDFVDYVH
jgi:DNA repair protein RecO (recombination protein O)